MRAVRRAELALGLGAFGIGTGEFAIMGLLPELAKGLAVAVPTAAHLISAYAGWAATGWVGAVLALLGMVIFASSLALERESELELP